MKKLIILAILIGIGPASAQVLYMPPMLSDIRAPSSIIRVQDKETRRPKTEKEIREKIKYLEAHRAEILEKYGIDGDDWNVIVGQNALTRYQDAYTKAREVYDRYINGSEKQKKAAFEALAEAEGALTFAERRYRAELQKRMKIKLDWDIVDAWNYGDFWELALVLSGLRECRNMLEKLK